MGYLGCNFLFVYACYPDITYLAPCGQLEYQCAPQITQELMTVSFLCFQWNLKSVQGHLGTVGKIIGHYCHSMSLSCFLALRATIGDSDRV